MQLTRPLLVNYAEVLYQSKGTMNASVRRLLEDGDADTVRNILISHRNELKDGNEWQKAQAASVSDVIDNLDRILRG
jgi:hypothetical protein